MSLTTTDLIKTISETLFPIQGTKTAEKSKQSFEKGKHVVNSILQTLQKAFANGESIRLVGFGTFNVTQISQRQGRNPRTGETITVKAKKRINFKGGKSLVEGINGESIEAHNSKNQ